MSRSRRHSPYTSLTTCHSEKDDKRIARRRLRQREKHTEGPVDKREVSNVWNFGKDGRQFVRWMDDPERWMRK